MPQPDEVYRRTHERRYELLLELVRGLTPAHPLDGELGDIHAALFVAERSGLIRSAVVTMSMQAQGQKADLEVTYRLRSTNRPVAGL